MRDQHIRFVERLPVPKITENRSYYQVRKDKPLVWLQEVCCWVLRKLGAYSEDHTTAYTHHTVDISDLVEGIYTQVGMLGSNHNLSAHRILMGSEDFAELCHAPQASYQLTVYASSPKFGGLTVTVIPWMKGVLVLPE